MTLGTVCLSTRPAGAVCRHPPRCAGLILRLPILAQENALPILMERGDPDLPPPEGQYEDWFPMSVGAVYRWLAEG